MFKVTGSMTTARSEYTATLLPDRKVLIAGGVRPWSDNATSAELYDPVAGTFTPTGSMTTARSGHTATLLADGKVLVAGGFNPTTGWLASAELYDPIAGTFTATGNLMDTRGGHTATLLPSGQVLIVGGAGRGAFTGEYLETAELYHPVTGTFTATGSMTTGRESHRATLLANGKVFVTGGTGYFGWYASAELYDPALGTFSAAGNMLNAREGHTATLLPNGNVLIAGGSEIIYSVNNAFFAVYAKAELYDPVAATFTASGSMTMARVVHQATLLPNGKVLIVGGNDSSNSATASAELYRWW